MLASMRCCRQWLRKTKAIWLLVLMYFGLIVLRGADIIEFLKTENKPSKLVLKWIGDAHQSSYINESRLRCAAENMGCFTLLRTATPTEVRSSFKLEQCLNLCFGKSTPFAGLLGEKCYCAKSVDNLVATRGCDAACSVDRARNCTARDSINLFMKAGGCSEGFTSASLNSQFVGCGLLPENPIGNNTSAWIMPHMTAEQCILKCESLGRVLAMPALRHELCFCSDLRSMFRTAETMQAAIKSCTASIFRALDRKDVFPIYRGYVEECAPKRFLKRREGPYTILTSFWGSGNTWLRHLIEVATGIYTGSVYLDDFLYRGGMLGEKQHPASGRTIIIKDHILTKPQLVNKKYTAAVLILRNPYDATLAEYARSHSHNNHTALLDPEIYESRGFKQSVRELPGKWFFHVNMLFNLIPNVLVVYYEDLKANPVRELKRVVSLLPAHLVPREGELEKRLMCMNLDLTGNFKRSPKGLRSNPYDDALEKLYNDTIKKTDALLKSKNKTGLPLSYFVKWHL